MRRRSSTACGWGRTPRTPIPRASAVGRWTSTARSCGALVGQLRALAAVCASAGTELASVKAHGALYEEVAKGGAIYLVLRDVVAEECPPTTTLVLPSGCPAMAMVVRDCVAAIEEGFCDRAYRPDGGLVDRSTPGAVLRDPEEAAGQALSLARGAVAASDGSILTLWVDTLCIHGDSPGAVAMAGAVRRLAESGIEVLARPVHDASVPVGEVRPFGDRALLVGVDDARAGRTAARVLEEALGGADVEVVVRDGHGRRRDADPTVAALEQLMAVVRDVLRAMPAPELLDAAAPAGRLVTIPCAFDGPDLAEVAALAGCSSDDVVGLLMSVPLTVEVVGFSPGLRVPRRSGGAVARGAAAGPPAAGRTRRVGGPGQRARRRVPDRFAGWLAARRADRLSSSPSTGRPTPPSRRVTGCSSRSPGQRPIEPVVATPPVWSPPRGRVPCSRCWRRDCARWCRTPGAAASRRRGARPPARPTRCRPRWPTGWP